MTKKIFIVIGIVVASIAVFVGAVFGVMALMGKFKTPDVYPDRLQFVENEQTIIYQEENSEKIYSFVLNGFSDNQDYEVNKKDCYIYFVDNVGADLITLCNEDGEPLLSENNYYSIECNEYVYYKIKPVSESDFSLDSYGQVILQARDSRSQIQSNNLIIWIDREVSNVYLDYADSIAYDGEQELTIGVDVALDFVFDADPLHSLDPINREEGKIVELYYYDPDESDYIPINQDTYSTLPFIKYDSDTQIYSFSSESSGTYEFKIAVFSTYQERADYLSSEYVETDSYFERVSRMVNTTLVLNVVNSDISNVGMNSTGVGLNLYSDNNYITLSGQSGVEGANDNNLGLYMIKDGQSTTIRFNEVDFDLNQSNNWMDEDIVFTSDDETKTIRFNQNSASITGFGDYDNTYNINFDVDNNRINLTDRSTGLITLRLIYALDNIKTDYNTTMIQSISCQYDNNTITFNCSTGVAFFYNDGEGMHSIKALKSGSYLEFYVYDTQLVQYTKANALDYSVTSIGSGETKSWNIIAKNNLVIADTESLVLGILVVNNNGGAHFASTGVTINPVELSFEFVNENQTHNLQVEYERDENQSYQAIYPELDFGEIVTITNGSYDACVFVTPKVEDGEVYDVDVIEGMIFIDGMGNEYVLVGYIEANQFKNKVRVRPGAVNSNTAIYMIQLRNQYDQTADDYIQSLFENEANNIVLRYSILMEDAEGIISTKFVDLTMFNGELNATLTDGSANISNVAVVNGDLVVTINNQEYVCTFVSVSRNGTEVCLANRQSADADAVAEIVNSYITDTRSVTITVSYVLLMNEISFNYNPGSVDGNTNPDGGDTFVNIVDGDVFVVENTTAHTLTITSNVPNMLKNIYNAGGFNLENVHINMYNSSNVLVSQNSNALEIQNLEFIGDSLVLTYNSNSALSNTDSYLRIVLEYNGSQILSDSKIYIESTFATDIQFKYTDENDSNIVNTITLSQTPEDALNSSFYIEVEISYNVNANGGAGGYEYRYFIVDNSNAPTRKEIYAPDLSQKLFNVLTNGEISEGFQVLPAITGIDKSISYSSTSPSIVDFDTENFGLIINKIGRAVAQVNSDDVTRYFTISVVAKKSNDESDFTLTDLSGGLGEDSTEELTVNLNEFISYSYNDDGSDIALKTNSQFVSIENVEVVQFGGDSELEVVRDETTGNIYIMIESDDGIDDGTINDELIVMRIESDENSWKFTRVSYLYAGLVIRFDINVKTNETLTYELTFTSSVEININSAWNNFYQGTTVLLYEESESGDSSNNPVFRIKNSISEGVSITSQVYINGSETPILIENEEFTFTDVGTYRFSFLHNNSELSSYTINVVPNVIAQINNSEFSGGETYNYSDFVHLKNFKAGVVYGTSAVGVYPQTDAYLEDMSSYTNLSLNLMQGTIISLGDNSTFTIGWIENIGEELIESIRISYNYTLNNANRSIDLLETQITLKNKYNISRETDGYPDYENQTYNIMSNINYNSFIEIMDNPQFTLSSIQSNVSNVIFSIESGNIFKLITNLSDIQNNVVLTFRFEDADGNSLIYTTSMDSTFAIRLIPLVPDELDTKAYSGLDSSDAFDLLNDLYAVNALLEDLEDKDIIDSIVVTGVSDSSMFADTVFIGSGYRESHNYGAFAVIQEIDGNKITITISYKITYSDGVEYEFTRELVINNRQYITITAPFEDDSLTDTTTSYVFVGEDTAKDAENLMAVYQSENVYQVTIKNIDNIDYYFEPVNIGQTINFKYDDIQSVRRVNVFNSQDSSVAPDADFTIELIARQNNANTSNYYNNNQIMINNENKTVKFNQHSSFGSNTYGYFIFKLTSESGAVAYYFVYLYNQMNTSYNNVDYTNVYTINSSESFDTQIERPFLDTALGTLLGVTIDSEFFNTNFGASINYSNVDFYLLDAEMLDGNYYDIVGSEYKRYSKIDDKNIPIISNYTYLKIGMLFNSGTVKFYIGTLDVYVLPMYVETNDGNITQMISGVESGEYIKNLNTDSSSYEIPFNVVNNRFTDGTIGGSWSAEIEEKDDNFDYTTTAISSNGRPIVSLEGTTVKLNSYVNYEDLEFTVKYIYTFGENRFVLKVNYIYEQIGINTSPQSVTVGNFVLSNEDEGSEVNSYFNNRLDLSTIIGNYKKNITILYSGQKQASIDLSNGSIDRLGDIVTFGNGCGMRYVYENDIHYLEFDQTTSDYVEQFEIRFDDVLDENNTIYTKTITANVLSGLYYSQPQSGIGYSEDNPHLSQLNTNQQYNSETGSQITINSSANADTGVTRYYFGGLNIYTNVDSSLEISFSDNSYIASLLEENQILTVNNTQYIDFTHTAQDKILTLNINVLSETGEYYQRSGTSLVINYFVNAQRTYAGLVASYYTVGANHENVVSGYSISDIYAELFTDISGYDMVKDIANSENSIINQKRIAIIDLNGNHILNYSPTALGFTVSRNPNYINFSAGEGASLPSSSNELTFSTVDTNTLANLYLQNNAGVSNVVYTYQIMSSSEYKDGLDYQLETNGTIGSSEYVTLLVEDTAEGTPLIYGDTTTENGQTVMLGNHIATLMDGNNSVLYITSLEIQIDGSRIRNYDIEKFNRVESSSYPDDIVYVLSNINDSDITLTIRLGTGRRLYVGLQRNSGSLFDTMSVKLTLFGDSGNLISIYTEGVLNSRELEIKFYNYSLESAYSTSYDSIYATNYIDLSEKISINSNADNETVSLSNAELVTGNSQGASSYSIGGNRYYISSIRNNIFDYETTTIGDAPVNLIMTKAVGVNINVSLIFKVSVDGYFIGNMQYNFLLRPNFEFRVNGSPISNGDDEFYTNYILTTEKLNATHFPYNEDLTTYESNTPILFSGSNYNTDLILELYTADGTNQKITDTNNVSITESSSWGTDYLTINNLKLTLNKDISGLVILRLDINLRENGTYTIYWNINILGFVTLQYRSVTGENAILTHSSGEAFSSGEDVPIINTSSVDGTGILMSDTAQVLNESPRIENDFEIKSILADYVIVPFTETVNADQLFNSNPQYSATLTYSNILASNNVSLVLPSVAQSSGPNYEYYNVIYRVYYTYLNQTTDYYYVTYKVYNSATVNVNSNFTIVDVDYDTFSDDHLDLFYYAENYVDTSNVSNSVTLHLDRDKNIVADLTLTGAYSGYTDTYTRDPDRTSDYISGDYTLRITSNNNINTIRILNSGSQVVSFTANRSTTTFSTYYDDDGEYIVNGSIFASEYSNIDDFQRFISSLDSIRLSNMTGFTGSNSEIYFALEYIDVDGIGSNGVFGIDLSKPKTDANLGTDYSVETNRLFDNELIADLDVIASGNSIIHIEKYDDNSNLGFKLTTTNAITPKGQFRVRDIFLPTQCSSTLFLDYVVVGVYSTSASLNWVTNANSVSVINDNVGTINVNGTEYTLRPLKCTGSPDRLYNLETTNYYAIYSPTGNIVTVDYGTNIQSYFFQVNYADTDSVLDLYGKFATYQNATDGTLTKTPYSSDSAILSSITDTEYSDITSDAGRTRYITVTKDKLREYKNNNPTATALSLNYSATYNRKSLTFRVDFQLPEYPFVESSLTGTGDISVNLLDNGLKVYNTNGELVELTSENIAMVSSIVENSTNYISEIVSSEDNYTGVIILNRQMIDQYFAENPSESQLSILLTLTTGSSLEIQHELQFNIVIVRT